MKPLIVIPDVTIVIPTYNGYAFLEKCLNSLERADLSRAARVQTLVLDNASTDGTSEHLGVSFPDVSLLSFRQNLGFVDAVNAGFDTIQSRWVFLVNNDVEVEPGFLETLLAHFDDQYVFGVNPRIRIPNLEFHDEGFAVPVWDHGWFRLEQPQRKPEDGVVPTLYANGAATLLDLDKVRSCRGIDRLYRPGFWDDIDLGYGAWKRGYKVLYDPSAAVVHHHSSTFKRKPGWTSRLMIRHALLFIWKNIADPEWRRSHEDWLWRRWRQAWNEGDVRWAGDCWAAFRRAHEALGRHRRECRDAVLTDREVFDRLNGIVT